MLEKMTRSFAVAIALFAVASTAAAQAPVPQPAPIPTAQNAVYFELGGNGIIYSVNYDRRFNNTWTGRAGFMVISAQATDTDTGDRVDVSLGVFPVMINALLGRGTHRLELGVGPLFAAGGGQIENADVGQVEEFSGAGLAGVTGTFGYRRQPLDGGFLFRAGLVPFYSGGPQIWAGISAGWAF
jgi:opacity protein-like surface antigen